jgi:hypothetical protein
MDAKIDPVAMAKIFKIGREACQLPVSEVITGWDCTEALYHPKVQSLIEAFHDCGLMQAFDWPEWQEEAERLYLNPELLAQADLATCMKLLTLHVRKERFCAGHFGAMVSAGHIGLILTRLQTLQGHE